MWRGGRFALVAAVPRLLSGQSSARRQLIQGSCRRRLPLQCPARVPAEACPALATGQYP